MVVPTLDCRYPWEPGIALHAAFTDFAIVLCQGRGPWTSQSGAPAAINTILGRVSAPPADAAVDRGTAGFHSAAAVGAPVDARPIGAGQEGAEQGVSGVLLVETGAAPGAHGDRPVNVEVGRQWRPERPVVGQLDIGEDVGFHAVKACSGVRRVMIAPHYAMVQFFGILPVPVLNSRSVPYPERGISRCVLGGVRFV